MDDKLLQTCTLCKGRGEDAFASVAPPAIAVFSPFVEEFFRF